LEADEDFLSMEFLADDEEDEGRKAIGNMLIHKCKCGKDCLYHLSGYAVSLANESVTCLSRNEKREWLRSKISENRQRENDKLVCKFYISGTEVCQGAFCTVLPYHPGLSNVLSKWWLMVNQQNMAIKESTELARKQNLPLLGCANILT